MKYEEFEKDIQRLKDTWLKIENVYEDSKKVFGDECFESPWYNTMYQSFELATTLIAEKYNDINCEWISWFIYENDWGNNKMEAGFKDRMFPIVTTEDLWNVMKEKEA